VCVCVCACVCVGEKYASLPSPIFEEAQVFFFMQVSFKSVACFTIVRQMAPLPSALSIAVENDVIV